MQGRGVRILWRLIGDAGRQPNNDETSETTCKQGEGGGGLTHELCVYMCLSVCVSVTIYCSKSACVVAIVTRRIRDDDAGTITSRQS